MLPYQTLIALDRHATIPLTQQITAAFIALINQGVLPARAKLPGSRHLAAQLAVSRQTVVVAFEDLVAQGWIEQLPSKAATVGAQPPIPVPEPLLEGPASQLAPRAGFTFAPRPAVGPGVRPTAPSLLLGGGSPDARLVPLEALARNYRAASRRALRQPQLLGYSAPEGVLRLRQQLARYLHDTRGVPAGPDDIFVTRGSTMAIHLLTQLLVQPGEVVAVAARSYGEADAIFRHHGAQLLRVPLDAHGLDTDALAQLCQQQRVRLVYVTPHHHYPTTVALSAARRVHLLQLAAQHDFVVLEDDYDFDYHYDGAPILPLASADRSGRVLYVGSLSKVLAPAYRIGYIVAPSDVLAALAPIRVLLDQLGDPLLELAVAELFADGGMQHHLQRSCKTYHERRDVFCEALHQHLAPWFSFTPPAGGLALWGVFAAGIDLPMLAAACARQGLSIGEGQPYRLPTDQQAHLRLGFAAHTADELRRSVHILEMCLRQLW
ncbi:MocR-like pyridoxine biosynthesis transcription factor PdxR [Hymenobacter jeollabukensis]|nr:PLP-dependent aminotransferase family protein [Hymenobacter jeollabukensis]